MIFKKRAKSKARSTLKLKKRQRGSGFEEAKKLRTQTIDQYGAYDQERAFLTELLESGEYIEALIARVAPTWFSDEDNRRYFTWLDNQYSKNGKVPSVERFQLEFPDFKGLTTGDSFKELVGALREKRIYQETSMSVKKIVDKMRDDAQGAAVLAAEEFAGILGRLSESTDTPIAKTRHRIKEAYEEAESMGGMVGTPLPWDALNKASRGARRGQYIALYGDAGTMKTFLAVYLAVYLAKQKGEESLFFSMEMTEEEIEMRYAAQMAEVDYEAAESGALNPKDRKKFFRAVDDLESSNFRVCCPVTTGQAVLAEIDAKIRQHKPRHVFIDGLGMLTGDNEWGGFAEINKGLKRIAKQRKVTIFVTHHTNREAVKDKTSSKAGDVALGDTLHRYCDMLCRVVREDLHKDNHELMMSWVKIRNGKTPCAYTIHAKPSYTFAQKNIVKQTEHGQANDNDDDEEENLFGKKKPGGFAVVSRLKKKTVSKLKKKVRTDLQEAA